MGHQATEHSPNPYEHLRKKISIPVPGQEAPLEFEYFDLVGGFSPQYSTLPYSIRVLLESAVRKCDNRSVTSKDVERIAGFSSSSSGSSSSDHQDVEIQFAPARVVLQDFTGVPAVVDLAAMRDSVVKLGGKPEHVNPVCPTDLVIDHSVQVDHFGGNSALEKNEELEFERNHERFAFLKWGASNFENMLIVPPGNGIVHQVNLEYLARVVFTKGTDKLLYPDSVVGTDSHTTMINGLGVVGWGVGGIEAEAVMMGLPMSMVLPKVVGYRLTGQLSSVVTSTDVVLTITKNLRQLGVVGKFIEFYGPGLSALSLADRATISNMCPEYGATCSFFPVDEITIQYLRQTNRDERDIAIIEAYLKAVKLFRDDSEQLVFSEIVELDLSTVVTCMSGPKRPHDRVDLTSMKSDFKACLSNKIGFKGFGLPSNKLGLEVPFTYEGKEHLLRHGSVLIAAITSCTNTSNPSVMLGAGLLARKAVAKGLTVAKYVKTSLSPGSGVVTYYLNESGVIKDLQALGFDIVGYGCMTCIGNSGPLPDEVEKAMNENPDLVCCGVLSGNRNFEGRIHQLLRANYLASPLLVIAYALAGRVDIDFETEPVQGNVMLRDIWPSRQEIHACEQQFVIPSMFKNVYSKIQNGNPRWNALSVGSSSLTFNWSDASTYIKRPPFIDDSLGGVKDDDLISAHCLLLLGDSVTTDHISPAGSIARNSPAARYLASKGLSPRDFNSYGSRRGNDEVMARGTFANIRLVNRLNKDSAGNVVAGPRTLYIPTGEIMDVYDASIRYSAERPTTPLIVIAGKEYGCGSSRDWAAKGTKMLNIRAIIAESYERIHRSNLVGMGILPLQFTGSDSAETLGLTGLETFTIHLKGVLKPKCDVQVVASTGKSFQCVARIDTDVELDYYRSGGILPFLVKKIASEGKQ